MQYVYAALDESEVAVTRQFTTALQEHGLRAEWVDGPTVRALEPRLAPSLLGEALHQDCFQMDAYRFVSALSQAAQRRGAHVQQGDVGGSNVLASASRACCSRTARRSRVRRWCWPWAPGLGWL